MIYLAKKVGKYKRTKEINDKCKLSWTESEKSHLEFHKIYGKKDNNDIQLLEFLTNKK